MPQKGKIRKNNSCRTARVIFADLSLLRPIFPHINQPQTDEINSTLGEAKCAAFGLLLDTDSQLIEGNLRLVKACSCLFDGHCCHIWMHIYEDIENTYIVLPYIKNI